jgi:hydroxymethylbilane synthase
MMNALVVGTRGSELALRQARQVVGMLKDYFPELDVRVRVIKTTGDKILDVPLAKIGDKGLFVKEIEQALIGGEIDFAVHSAKDMPSETDGRLLFAAYPEREDPSDALVSKSGTLAELPPGSVIGTSSVRRRAQVLHARPDLNITDLRGNLDTRLRKLCGTTYDAIVLARAGLARMGLEMRITQVLPFDVCLPAAAQGALAIQCRTGDPVAEKIAVLDHAETRACVSAERELLLHLGAGCQAPIGTLARVIGDGRIELEAAVVAIDGSEAVRRKCAGNMDNPQEIGGLLAEELFNSRAVDLLAEARRNAGPRNMGAAG